MSEDCILNQWWEINPGIDFCRTFFYPTHRDFDNAQVPLGYYCVAGKSIEIGEDSLVVREDGFYFFRLKDNGDELSYLEESEFENWKSITPDCVQACIDNFKKDIV